MLKINKKIVSAIFAQGKKDAPIEACGYLVGKKNNVLKHYEMTNLDQREDHFTLDPKEQFKVLKETRKDDLEILSIYHTHPETPARPSQEDIKLAFDSNIIYVIASFADNNEVIKGFRIVNGKVSTEELIIE